jgi:hypothetical protein
MHQTDAPKTAKIARREIQMTGGIATVAVIGNAKTAAVIDDATETTRMKT